MYAYVRGFNESNVKFTDLILCGHMQQIGRLPCEKAWQPQYYEEAAHPQAEHVGTLIEAAVCHSAARVLHSTRFMQSNSESPLSG